MGVCEESGRIGYGVLDAESGIVIASDAVLDAWLGSRPLAELLPDVEFPLATALSKQTRLFPSHGEPVFAKMGITPLVGKAKNWWLLRIEITSTNSNLDQYLDVVTGLPDRRALETHRAQWQRESRDGQMPHALLFMDLDGFKQINDQFGHAVGDRVLAVLAERWRKALRSRDLLVRHGGDEFVALIAGVGSLQDAQPILHRLKQVTTEPLTIDNRTLGVEVAIGVAFAPSAAMPLKELLAVADKSMYAAKRSIH